MPRCAVPVLPPTTNPGTAIAVAVPPCTTPTIASRRSAAEPGSIGVRHTDGWKVVTVLPSESRTSWSTCGFMILPSLAMAAATSAICRGLADTSFWPMADWASLGRLRTKPVGNTDAAGLVRSIGILSLNPNASAVLTMSGAPMRTPMSAKALLQDTCRMANKVPPQVSGTPRSSAKFLIGCPVGGVNELSCGNDGVSLVTLPEVSPAVEVTSLKVEPGK